MSATSSARGPNLSILLALCCSVGSAATFNEPGCHAGSVVNLDEPVSLLQTFVKVEPLQEAWETQSRVSAAAVEDSFAVAAAAVGALEDAAREPVGQRMAEPVALSQVSVATSETHRTAPSYGRRALEGQQADISAHSLTLPAVFAGMILIGISYVVMECAGVSEPLEPQVMNDTPRIEMMSSRDVGEDDAHRCRNMSIHADTFGLAIMSMTRDCRWIAVGDNAYDIMLRASRLSFSMMLITVQVFLQVFLILDIMKLATSKEIAAIRNIYSQYEFTMHGSDPTHVYETSNGFYRGFPQHFNAANFGRLDASSQQEMCNIPLSQDYYFFAVVFIWTLSCAQDVRSTLEMLWSLVLSLPTIAHVRHSTKKLNDGDGNEVLVVGLTSIQKLAITYLVLVPRLCITIALLLLGCTWLGATTNFADLVLNAVALQFVLHFKDIFYFAIVPERSRQDVAYTQIPPVSKKVPPDTWSMLGAFIWGLVAFAWCWLYIYHLQAVLPDYKWDVRLACRQWIEKNYQVTKT